MIAAWCFLLLWQIWYHLWGTTQDCNPSTILEVSHAEFLSALKHYPKPRELPEAVLDITCSSHLESTGGCFWVVTTLKMLFFKNVTAIPQLWFGHFVSPLEKPEFRCQPWHKCWLVWVQAILVGYLNKVFLRWMRVNEPQFLQCIPMDVPWLPGWEMCRNSAPQTRDRRKTLLWESN